MALEEWKTAVKEGWAEWCDKRGEIIRETVGIERQFGLVIYALKMITALQIPQLLRGKSELWPPCRTESFVVIVTIVLGGLLLWSNYLPGWLLWVAAGYILANDIIILLNVLFLSKLFGSVASYERTLILFMLNIVQVLLIFAIFYRLRIPDLDAVNAVFETLLVFGTIGYPKEAKAVAGFQIAIDFLLLAVFLGHFVGRLGPRKEG